MKAEVTKNIKTTLIIFNIIMFLFCIITFILKDKIKTLIYPLNVSFFMLLLFFSIILLGYKKNKKTYLKNKINNIFIIISIFYLMTIYLAGNATGYIKNELNIANIIYLIIYLIISEIFRYTILNKCSRKTIEQYIITFLFIIFDILILSSFSPSSTIDITTILMISLISTIKNSLLSYTSYKYGFYPCFIYNFIISILPLIAPIYPSLGNYLNTVFISIYSTTIFYNISRPNRKDEEETQQTYKKGFLFYFERIILVLIVVIICLVSGNFRYSLNAIASDSMYPTLQRGDAIIIEKVDENNINSLKKGTIVAFEEDGEVITHRILTIELVDGEEYIITKGDNNSTKDVTKKTKDDIIGIVKLRIPLLGYPSVEISELKN